MGTGLVQPTEREWNAAIIEWYFGRHMNGRPVYLSVDDASLKLIASAKGWDSSDAIASLRNSLGPYLDQGRPFDYWDDAADRWAKRGAADAPPFVHVLALTVLPFTERRGTDTLAGYYRPLFEILGISDSPVRREDYRLHVPELWKWLGKWLGMNRGMFGLPTARPGSHATEYFGYSRSQAIVRSSDRAAFIDFFEQAGYRPGETVPADLLLARFERWVRHGASDRLRQALTDDAHRAALSSIVLHDLETWSGESRDEDFRRVLRIVPRLNAARRTATVVLRCPPNFPGIMQGDRVVAPPGQDRVFADVVVRWLPENRRENLSFGAETLQFRHSEVHAFEEDPILGGYTAVDRLTLGRSGWLAVSDTASTSLRYLSTARLSSETWASLPGWQIFRNVKLDPYAVDLPPALAGVAPPSGLRAELRGGLPLGSRRYLEGGSPDLVVPECPVPLEVKLDGVVAASVQPDKQTVVRFSDRSLPVGAHSIEVGDQVLRFQIEAHQREKECVDPICHVVLEDPPTVLDLCRVSETIEDDVVVTGARIRRRTSLAPTDSECYPPATDGWMVFASDGISTVLPASPPWLSAIDQTSCCMPFDDLEALAGHSIAWVARVMARRVLVRRAVASKGVEQDAGATRCFGSRTVLVRESDLNEWSIFARDFLSTAAAPLFDSQSRPTTPAGLRKEQPTLDRILAWCSQRLDDSIEHFVETCQWLDGSWGDPKSAYRALRSLNRLGHIEVDWHHRRWSICPPAIVAPVNAGGLAFHVGQRLEGTVERLEELITSHDLDAVVLTAAQQVSGPVALLIRAGTRQDLQTLGALAGLPVRIDAAGDLGRLLPTVDRMVQRGRINGGFERRRISIGPDGPIFTPQLDDAWNGSYEHDAFGPMIYSISESNLDDARYLVDRSTAIWYALRRERSYPVDYDATSQTLTVSTKFGLPLLHERALILSTGLLPRVERQNGSHYYVYENVIPSLAGRVREVLT